jgi:hypothetical protein
MMLTGAFYLVFMALSRKSLLSVGALRICNRSRYCDLQLYDVDIDPHLRNALAQAQGSVLDVKE